MKIRPVILCGGAGTRLWPNLKNTQAKQFIDFGGWTLLEKAFERINNNSYDCLLYTSPSPRDRQKSRMPSSA